MNYGIIYNGIAEPEPDNLYTIKKDIDRTKYTEHIESVLNEEERFLDEFIDSINVYKGAKEKIEKIDKEIHDVNEEINDILAEEDVNEFKLIVKERRIIELIFEKKETEKILKKGDCPHEVVALSEFEYICLDCHKKGSISKKSQIEKLKNTDKIIIPVDCEIFDERTNQIIDELHSWYTKLKEKGYTIEQIRDEANNLNCDDYINKPYQKKK